MSSTASGHRVNPKLLIINYLDLLINRVDIHTEEALVKNSQTIELNKLNATRDEMIKRIEEAQCDALEQLETIKNDLIKTLTTSEGAHEKVFEAVFANRFLFLVEIESFKHEQKSLTRKI